MGILRYVIALAFAFIHAPAQAKNVSMKDPNSDSWKAGDILDETCEIVTAKQDKSRKFFEIVCKDGTKITIQANFKPAEPLQ